MHLERIQYAHLYSFNSSHLYCIDFAGTYKDQLALYFDGQVRSGRSV